MKTIWKFPLCYQDQYALTMPVGPEPISVGHDPQGSLCMWAIVDDSRAKVAREIQVIGTGNPMPDEPGKFVGTVCEPPFMWHIFIKP